MSRSTHWWRRAGLSGMAVALVLGSGLSAVAPASATTSVSFERVAGPDRYATAAAAAGKFGNYEQAVLVSGESGRYADALSAAYLAGALDAPILLTRGGKTPAVTLRELSRAGVDRVTVVGGAGVVSAAQVRALGTAGYDVRRVSGDDRYGTNAAVLAAGGNAVDGLGLIATGTGFADALAAGPLAFRGHALGLARAGGIDDAVLEALADTGVSRVLIIGGADAVGPAVVKDLEAAGIDIARRLAGANRSATSVAVADYATSALGVGNEKVNVASGDSSSEGADALSGGALTGHQNRPLLISGNSSGVSDLLPWMRQHADTVSGGLIFGGSSALSTSAVNSLTGAATTSPGGLPGPVIPPTPSVPSTPSTWTFGPNSLTGAPELQSVSISPTDATVVTYRFDETIPGQALEFIGVAPARSYPDFRLYQYDGSVDYPREARIEGNSVIARFASAADVKSAVRGGVKSGAVEDGEGIANIEGEIPMAATLIKPPVAAPFSPQLVEVKNFRLADVITGGAQEVLVDFVFDGSPLGLVAGDFHLVGASGTDWQSIGLIGVPSYSATSKLWTVTVQMANDLTDVPESQLRRGYVTYPTTPVILLSESEASLVPFFDWVVLSETYENSDGSTVDPDLLNALVTDTTAGAYKVKYQFDEAISDTGLNEFNFYLYDTDGNTIWADQVARSALAGDGAKVVIATFDTTVGGFGAPVGAYLAGDAVRASDNTSTVNGGWNVPDERTLTLPAPGAGTTIPAGHTLLPDLMAVDVSKNEVTENWSVSYVFDEPAAEVLALLGAANFDLYDAKGTRFRSSGVNALLGSGVTVVQNTAGTLTSVTFSIDDGFPLFDNEQIAAAVTGGVEDGLSVVESIDVDPTDAVQLVDTIVDPLLPEGQQKVS